MLSEEVYIFPFKKCLNQVQSEFESHAYLIFKQCCKTKTCIFCGRIKHISYSSFESAFMQNYKPYIAGLTSQLNQIRRNIWNDIEYARYKTIYIQTPLMHISFYKDNL